MEVNITKPDDHGQFVRMYQNMRQFQQGADSISDGPDVDPVFTEISRQSMRSVAEEMREALDEYADEFVLGDER